MRVVLAIFFVVGVTLAVEDTTPHRDLEYPPQILVKALKPLHNTCVEITETTDETIKKFSEGEIFDDKNLACYMQCMFREAGVLTSESEVDVERMLNMLPTSMQEVARKMGENCQDIQGDGPCERAMWLHKCWKMADPKHYFLV